MKINFLTLNKNDNSGSYRIWVRDLSKTINEIGIESNVKTSIEDIDKDIDVLILCKSAYKISFACRQKVGKDVKIGAINIDKNYTCNEINFIIVGSPEEYASISSYRNVFIYPLIERKFENIKRKIHHTDGEVLKFCFHGHYPHLFKFRPFLKHALEYVDKNIRRVSLSVITGHKDFNWTVDGGKPDIQIKMLPYDENISNYINDCDIGLVPNVSDVRMFSEEIAKVNSVDWGLYDTDYFMRYKNKTNAGRSYVFYQHGIPVIHDLSPSSFELMKITGYNICAHDTSSWIREMIFLSSCENREKVSKSYYDTFKANYDVHILAKKLLENIRGV